MNAMVDSLSAQYNMTCVDWIIQNELMDFKNVQFIGSEYKPLI